MKTKTPQQVKLEDLRFNSYLVLSEEKVNSTTVKQEFLNLLTTEDGKPDIQTITSNAHIKPAIGSIQSRANLQNNTTIPIKIGNMSYNISQTNLLGALNLSYTTIRRTKEQSPEVYKIIAQYINPDFIKQANKLQEVKAENYRKMVQTQFDNLMSVHEQLGYKADIRTLNEVADLYYCEAKTFLDKMESKIYKKGTAKALRLSKLLDELKGKEPISCNEG